MESGLFMPVCCFAILKYSQRFSSHPHSNRQSML